MASKYTSPAADLVYQRDAKQYKLITTIEAVFPLAQLDPASKTLFKQVDNIQSNDVIAVVTRQTIFHPQGGGQPSDEGIITAEAAYSIPSSSSSPSPVVFQVLLARHDVIYPNRVLHFGRFLDPKSDEKIRSPSTLFKAGLAVQQAIDIDKRLLYSQLHTAGHILGAAVRHLVEAEVNNFDELKASHFPNSAACEFRGRMEGRWLASIQQRVNDYINRALPVEIDWWDEHDFHHHSLERLLPTRPPSESLSDQAHYEKLRVVKIVGADTYPCGGTHVDTTDLCGPARVTKISRVKGNSRVSYVLV